MYEYVFECVCFLCVFVCVCICCMYLQEVLFKILVLRFHWDVCIIIHQLTKNFGRGRSALNSVCCCNIFRCCCFADCSSTSNTERRLSLFAFPMKSKRLLKRWVRVIRRAKSTLNRHTRTCRERTVNTEGRRLYSDEVPSLTLPSNNRNFGNNWRKLPQRRIQDSKKGAYLSRGAKVRKLMAFKTYLINVRAND